MFKLNKIKDYKPLKTTLNLYKSMVLPSYEFGNLFLLGCNKTELVKLQRVQFRHLRQILYKDRFYSTELLLKDARLANWEMRARLAASRLMFKYKYD